MCNGEEFPGRLRFEAIGGLLTSTRGVGHVEVVKVADVAKKILEERVALDVSIGKEHAMSLVVTVPKPATEGFLIVIVTAVRMSAIYSPTIATNSRRRALSIRPAWMSSGLKTCSARS